MAEIKKPESNETRNQPRVIDISKLMGQADAIQIQYGERRYELRQTRFGKLILTKSNDSEKEHDS